MRTRHWLAAITSGCLALAGVGDAIAQQGPLYSNGNPDEVRFGMLPGQYGQSYGPAQPGTYPGTYQPGYPPGANPWPEVSPYMGPPFQATVFEDGFWYKLMKQGNRNYYFSAEALLGTTSKPSTALIGAPNVNLLNTDAATGNIIITVTGGTSGTTGGTGQSNGSTGGLTQFNQAPVSGPIRSASSSGGGTTGGDTGGTGGGGSGSTGVINIFPTQDTGILPDNLFTDGIRGTWGWDNSDGSGFVVSGFSTSKGVSTFQLLDKQLNLNLDDYRNYNATLHLHAWFGLPLSGADTDGTSFSGTLNDGAVIPYDMGVIVQFASRLAGANTDWYFSPMYEREKIKVRTMAGARYLRLQEGFLFDGTDSGMGYTVSAGSSGTTGGGQTTSGGGGGGTNIPGYLTPTTFQSGFATPNVIRSHLESTTIADMGGPEVGFRVDLGGKKFQLWTQTKAGALANVSQRQITGFGIGNAFNIITPNTVAVMPRDPTATYFSTSQTTTTFTPMFEQQINTKIPIFNLVPYLNKMEAFERAYLTGGYTFLFLGDTYRPHNAVIWNQWPQTPELNRHKSNYMNHLFNIGVEWNY